MLRRSRFATLAAIVSISLATAIALGTTLSGCSSAPTASERQPASNAGETYSDHVHGDDEQTPSLRATKAKAAEDPRLAWKPLLLTDDERLVTIIGTNDLHGGLEPSINRTAKSPLNGQAIGGMAMLGGTINAIRKGLQNTFGDHAGVIVTDAGDQFQGTLLSNRDEGETMWATMRRVGYCAIIPGNHDFDFGPLDWLVDGDVSRPDKARESLELLVKRSKKMPLISANIFYKTSIVDQSGTALNPAGTGCRVKAGATVDWPKAQAPKILKPYVIKKVAGVRVALIGIDNPGTPTTTTPENVEDLCFAPIVESVTRARQAIGDQADVFVLVTHNGDTDNSFEVSEAAQALADAGAIDAVVAGHTHYRNHFATTQNVRGIQSGANALAFGRIDLVWDVAAKRLNRDKTRSAAGVQLSPSACDDENAAGFCKVVDGAPAYEGVRAVADDKIARKVAKARARVDVEAKVKLGVATATITVDRNGENAMANQINDAFREIARSDVAMVNNSGLRTSIPKGDVTYEQLYRVLPFNNHAVVIDRMPVKVLVSLVKHSIKTCGEFGALMASGIRVRFEKNCNQTQIDEKAKLLSIDTFAGEPVYKDGQGTDGIVVSADRTFSVATFDFLAKGGSGYSMFKGTPESPVGAYRDLGILRELLKDLWIRSPAEWNGRTDGRWSESKRP